AKGIVDPVTAAEAPNLQSLPASLVFPAGPTIWLSPRGIFYRVDKTPFEIKTWEDLWDPRLKGMITTSIDEDRGIFLMIAALLAGGSEKNIDPGFEKLKSLKPNIGVIYKSDADSLKFIQSGEVSVAGYGLLGVIYKHLGPGSPYKFVVPPKPQYMSVNLVTLIKGRPNRDAAVKVLNALLAPDIQERLVEYIGSLHSNQNAKPPSRIRDLIPPLGDLFRPDWD